MGLKQPSELFAWPEKRDEWMDFEERAAILEYDGGHSREEAERLAAGELGMSLLFNRKGR